MRTLLLLAAILFLAGTGAAAQEPPCAAEERLVHAKLNEHVKLFLGNDPKMAEQAQEFLEARRLQRLCWQDPEHRSAQALLGTVPEPQASAQAPAEK